MPIVMTSQARRTEETNVEAADQDGLKSLPHGDKLMAFAEELSSGLPAKGAASNTTHTDVAGLAASLPAKRFSAADAAGEAGHQIEALVRMKVDGVSAVKRSEAGWDVTVNVVELTRIPNSTDVLAAYHVCLDAEGNLMSYSRGARYTRDQVGQGL